MKLSHKIIFVAALVSPLLSFASMTDGTIQNQYAWGNNTGWVNFLTDNGNIHISDTGITGYAWDSRYGWINMNPTNGGVANDGEGNLSGSAWSAGGGWIDFDDVSINSSGKFVGIAEGDVYGQLTFNCDNCNVRTDWRPVSVREDSEGDEQTGSDHGGGSYIKKTLPASQATSSTSVRPTTSVDESNLVDEAPYTEATESEESVTYIKPTSGKTTPVIGEQVSTTTAFFKFIKIFFWLLVVMLVLRTALFAIKR